MQLTPEYLQNTIAKTEEQRAEYLAMFHKADGAIQALRQLLAILETEPEPEPDAMTEDELARLVAGAGAVSEGMNAIQNDKSH